MNWVKCKRYYTETKIQNISGYIPYYVSCQGAVHED